MHTSRWPAIVATAVSVLLGLMVRAQTSPVRATANPPATSTDPIITLDEFSVTTDRDNSYKATNVLSGTRFNTTLLDLPKALDVVTREFMEDIGARDITEALQYTSGIAVTRESDSAGKTDTEVLVRGFTGGGGGVSSGGGNQYIDGYRTFGNFDPISIERIEILKGPSSLFSGAIGAGGAMNTLIRKPSAQRSGSISLAAGTFDQYRAEVQMSGAMTANKKLLYWLGAAVQDYGSHLDFANYKRIVVSPTLVWKAAPRTEVTVFAQAMRNEQGPASHPVFMNTGLSLYLPVRRSFNRMGPEAFNDSDQLHAVGDVVHKFNDTWTAKIGGMYRAIASWRNLITGGTTATVNAATGARTVLRTAASIANAEHGYTGQAYLLGKLNYWKIDHRTVAGLEYFSQSAWEDVGQQVLAVINIDNPSNYPVGNPLTYPRLAGRYNQKRLISRSYSTNNLWQAFDQRFTVQFGYRRDEIYQSTDDYRNPAANSQGKSKPADLTSGGAAFRILPRAALFFSFSQSYEPLVKADYFGRPFDPREGKGMDYGLRWDMRDGRISGSVTGFKITNSNLEQADPDHAGFQLQTGENESQGVEFSLMAQPIKGWQVVGSYTYNETRVVKDPRIPANVGLPTANAPKNSWSLWNRYRFATGLLRGLGLGAGVVYVGERRGNPNLANNPGIRSQEFHRVQFNVAYTTTLLGRRTTVSLNANNAFDAVYKPSYAAVGEPRNIMAKVTYHF